MDKTKTTRTNEQWLTDLHPDNPTQQEAITALRQILVKGLRWSLAGWVETTGAQFDALAEDFAQEALLKILANLHTFRGDSKFTTWAHKITVRVGLTELRRKRWRNLSLDNLVESDDGHIMTPSFTADPNIGPDKTNEQRDMMDRVQRILTEELTDKQRTALITARVQGVPMDQVASLMNMNRNALYKLLHDARLRLKKRLAREGLTPQEVLSTFD